MRKILLSSILVMLFITCHTLTWGQNLVVNGNMESDAGWAIADLTNSGIKNYTFNYSGDSPTYGSDGKCLRVIGDETSGFKIAFTQQITFAKGKTYVLDAGIKTASENKDFYTQIYITDKTPVSGTEFNPSDDITLGISTWKGCGSDLDSLMSEIYCQGKGKYFTAPGQDGDTTLNFVFRIGTNGTYTPKESFEVLLDDLSVKLFANSMLTGTQDGILDESNKKVTGATPLINVKEFKNGLSVPHGAKVNIVYKDSVDAAVKNDTTLDTSMIIRVYGNETVDYAVEFRALGTGKDITWSFFDAVIDNNAGTITNIPPNFAISQLMNGLKVSEYAIYTVVGPSGKEVVDHTAIISDTLKVLVMAEDSSTKSFTIGLGGTDYTETLSISGTDGVYDTLKYKIITVEDSTIAHITSPANTLDGSIMYLKKGNSWIYFDSVKPSAFIEKYIRNIAVDSQPAKKDINVRIARYNDGTIIITQSSEYNALTVYKGENLTGESMVFKNTNLNTDNAATPVGDFDNTIQSFTLKKGWMATFAQNSDGTGYSRVYIADEQDLTVNKLPQSLNGNVSFIKVFPWSWPRKKGWCGGNTDLGRSCDIINGDWLYAWNAGGKSSADIDYVPMRHNKNWPGWNAVTIGKNENHVLGFNEPTHKDQANMTLEEMINQWPNILKTGLRVGSPAPADNGINRLYNFIDRCEELNYRVDFIAMHWYLGNQTPKQMYNRLKAIHKRCGNRPIWITEWNNGAGWTDKHEKVTETIQEKELPGFLHMLDTTPFVERYSIYNWVGDGRRMIRKDGSLTPAGEIYKDNNSPMAFNRDFEFVPTFKSLVAPFNLQAKLNGRNITLSWLDNNGTHTGYEVQRADNDGEWKTVAKTTTPDTKTYTDSSLANGTYKYRILGYSTDKSKESNIASATININSVENYGLNESNYTFSLYPNPAKAGEKLNISVTQEEGLVNGTLNIYTINNTLVKSFSLTGSDSEEINIDLNPGIYFVVFSSRQKTISKKLIVTD